VIRVKICGITNVGDARVAVEAGADALGFIFVEGTPRFVTPEQVAPIVRTLPPFVTPVGVFWDHPAGHVKAVAEACRLRALQLHGDEAPEDLADYVLPVIKTVKMPPASTIEGLLEYRMREGWEMLRYRHVAAAILLDSTDRWSEGEAREPLEWTLARTMSTRGRSAGGRGTPIILSGGLTPDNVARAVAVVRPYGVDVNSGVELTPGRKDADKVRRFVAEAQRG
jgi:phosphoribosylanthranilate isomerase